MRAQLIKARTALVNQMRGLLAERGIVVGKGLARLRHALAIILDREGRLGEVMRELVAEMGKRLRQSDERIKRYDLKLGRIRAGSAPGSCARCSAGSGNGGA